MVELAQLTLTGGGGAGRHYGWRRCWSNILMAKVVVMVLSQVTQRASQVLLGLIGAGGADTITGGEGTGRSIHCSSAGADTIMVAPDRCTINRW